MTTALIGYTGFVGSNFKNQNEFTDLYNSKNIHEIEGKEYDLVVSAANRAEMWRINQQPEKDLAEIEEFISHIKKATIHKLVLISSVGVYKTFKGVDEDTVINADDLLPYGANRLHLEKFCRDNFDTLVIRLPGLFGLGLKKNVIFDLIHDNNVDRIHEAGVYQYYNLEKIWADTQTALKHNLGLVNFATEPVSTKELAKTCFNLDFTNKPDSITPTYFDMHTKHAKVFGGTGGYIYSKQQELEDIANFVSKEKSNV